MRAANTGASLNVENLKLFAANRTFKFLGRAKSIEGSSISSSNTSLSPGKEHLKYSLGLY